MKSVTADIVTIFIPSGPTDEIRRNVLAAINSFIKPTVKRLVFDRPWGYEIPFWACGSSTLKLLLEYLHAALPPDAAVFIGNTKESEWGGGTQALAGHTSSETTQLAHLKALLAIEAWRCEESAVLMGHLRQLIAEAETYPTDA